MKLPNSSLTQEITTSQNSKLVIVQDWLKKHLAEQLSLEVTEVNVTEQLTRYGLDSIDAVTLVGDLEDYLNLELPSTLFWEYQTIQQASSYLVENYEFPEIALKE